MLPGVMVTFGKPRDDGTNWPTERDTIDLGVMPDALSGDCIGVCLTFPDGSRQTFNAIATGTSAVCVTGPIYADGGLATRLLWAAAADLVREDIG